MKFFALATLSLLLLMGSSTCGKIEHPETAAFIASPIKVFFTLPPLDSTNTEEALTQPNKTLNALIELIGNAQKTLDIAIYSFSLKSIAIALTRACQRNVRVRLVMERESAKSDYFPNSPACPAIKLDENSALMHEKFMIIDEASVWIGSLNWTCLDLYTDANNVLLIHDASIAASFKQEFDEMFSGHFGKKKTNPSYTRVNVDETMIDLFFLPNKNAHNALHRKIDTARSSIYIAMYAFTDNLLKEALLDAKAHGVQVHAVWDYQSLTISGSDVLAMVNRDVGVLDALAGLVHHKFAVIDEKTVIMGSANWSRAGFESNDENLLIIEDAQIARAYLAHWKQLYDDAIRYDYVPLDVPRLNSRVFPRSEDHHKLGVSVQWRPHFVHAVDEYELCRALSSQGPCEKVFPDLAPGSDGLTDESVLSNQTYYYRLRGRVGDRWSEYSNEYSTDPSQNCHE